MGDTGKTTPSATTAHSSFVRRVAAGGRTFSQGLHNWLYTCFEFLNKKIPSPKNEEGIFIGGGKLLTAAVVEQTLVASRNSFWLRSRSVYFAFDGKYGWLTGVGG
jgi:hypothetical protein